MSLLTLLMGGAPAAPPVQITASDGAAISVSETAQPAVVTSAPATAVDFGGNEYADTFGGVFTITLPTDTVEGDFFFISINVGRTAANGAHSYVSIPAGATTVLAPTTYGNSSWAVHTWRAPANPPTTLTFDMVGTDDGSIAWGRFKNVDATNPFDVAFAPTAATAANNAVDSPAITLASDGSLPVIGMVPNSGSGTYTVASPWLIQVPDLIERDNHMAVRPSGAGTAGEVVGPVTWTRTGTAAIHRAYSFALKGVSVAITPKSASDGGSLAVADVSSAPSIIDLVTKTAADTSSIAVAESTSTVTGFPTSVETLTWLWTGTPLTDGAPISTKVSGGTSFRMRISTAADLLTNPIFTTAVSKDANNIVKITPTGLSAGTQYYYGIEIDGAVATKRGKFKTAPVGATNFSIAFSSCNNSNATSTAYQRILDRSPDMFLHLGDFHYDNIATNDTALFRAAYDKQFAKADAQADLFAAVPTVYTWSDHDFGPNNAVGTSASRPAAQATYRQVVPSPVLPSASDIYYTFVYGRVRFIVTDNRSNKSPQANTDDASKTIMGATQKQWFKDTITAATEPLILWLADVPWTNAAAADDEYSNYNTERQELGSFVAASGKKVIYLNGDSHAIGANDGSVASPGNIPSMSASALNQTASQKGTYTSGPYPATAGAVVQQYGMINITDDGTTVTAAYTGYDTTDIARTSLTVTATPTSNVSKSASDTGSIAADDSSEILFRGISASDTSSIATSEVSNVGSTLPGTESVAVSIVETRSIAVTLSTSDTGSVSVAETRTQSITFSSTDTASVSISDAGVNFTQLSANDTCAISTVETTSLTKNIDSSDIGSISASENSVVSISVSASDMGSIAISDVASQANATASSETSSISVAEATNQFVTVSTTDTGSVAVSETASSFRTFTSTDTASIAITDVGSAGSSLPGTESIAIGVADIAVIVTSITTTDTGSIAATDASSLTASLSTTDTSGLSVTENAASSLTFVAVDAGAISISETRTLSSTLTRSDTGAVSVSETDTIFNNPTATDAGAISVSESSTVASTGNASDAGSVSLAETTTVFVTVSATDTGSLSAGESFGSGSEQLASDSGAIAIGEAVTINVSVSRGDAVAVSTVESVGTFSFGTASDTNSIAASESVAFGPITISRADQGSITINETTSSFRSISATDFNEISVSEFSTAPSGTNLSTGDNDGLQINETIQNIVSSSRTDTGSIAASDISNIVNKSSASDTGSISETETRSVLVTISVFDSSSIAIVDSTSSGGDSSISAADSISVSASETRTVSVVLSSSDTGAVVVSETNTFANTMTSSDYASISVAEVNSRFITRSANDSGSVSVSEVTVKNVNLSSTETIIVSTNEGAERSQDEYASDSGSIAVSETSMINTTEGSVVKVWHNRAWTNGTVKVFINGEWRLAKVRIYRSGIWT